MRSAFWATLPVFFVYIFTKLLAWGYVHKTYVMVVTDIPGDIGVFCTPRTRMPLSLVLLTLFQGIGYLSLPLHYTTSMGGIPVAGKMGACHPVYS